jgi:glycosyltransferase involved in cell wall biosynthesis
LVDAHKDYLGKYFAYPSEKIFRYLSAPLDIFTPDFSISGNYILSMGVARRDYPTLIKALGKLPKCTTQIYAASRYFEIYKGGIPEKFPKWIDINTNYGMTTDGIVDLYRNARFVVIPLKTSHQLAAGGSTVLEAMATGKAVIATDTPGMRDFIIDGVTGFLVPPGDDGSLRERISSLWNEPEKATRMGIEARKYAQEKYDPEILNLGMRQAILGAYLDSSSKPARA